MTRTAQMNADEFRQMDEGEGWPFARLVAHSVYNFGQRRPTEEEKSRARLSGKVDATEFARLADTGNDRVLRYLAAWQRAAKAGVVADADTLTAHDSTLTDIPSDPEHSWLTGGRWRYGPSNDDGSRQQGGKFGSNNINRIETIAKKAEKNPEYASQVLEAVAKSSPKAMQQAVRKAQADEDRRWNAAQESARQEEKRERENATGTVNDAVRLLDLLYRAHRALSEAVEFARSAAIRQKRADISTSERELPRRIRD